VSAKAARSPRDEYAKIVEILAEASAIACEWARLQRPGAGVVRQTGTGTWLWLVDGEQR
jgi:hypothetical protein